MLSSGSVRLLEAVHEKLCLELMRADLEGRFEDVLESLIPDAKQWFAETSTKNTNTYTFESDSYVMSTCMLNGLEMMLDWILRVAKFWLDSKNGNYLCTGDLACIMEKSPLYSFHSRSNDIGLMEVCDKLSTKSYAGKVRVLFNNSVETERQDDGEMGEIKETLEKLMVKISVKEK